jgi:hypothetical protein
MLLDNVTIELPDIDESIDDQFWTLPHNVVDSLPSPELLRLVGQRTLRSTTFHWTARLAVLCRKILEAL